MGEEVGEGEGLEVEWEAELFGGVRVGDVEVEIVGEGDGRGFARSTLKPSKA